MAGLIPKYFIDDLLSRTDIVEVINARVPLKKKGREYSACCPFHNEKSPSFTVSPEKQFYHCFGCGAHGTAISFLMEFDRLDFVEAIEALADIAGIEVEREQSNEASPRRDEHQSLHNALHLASHYFQAQLRVDERAKQYLQKRGVSGEIARDFQLGYAPSGWDGLLKELEKKVETQTLFDAGLLSRNEAGRQYDKFRDRIMFPIRDSRGRTIAFGGRVMESGEPKYLNSPETPVFHKGGTLYGLFEARQQAAKLDHFIVVEGYMDVIALAQYGIRNAVATLGTATTPEHLKKLLRLVPRIVFCFDGDRAGKDAAWRALTHAISVIHDGQRIDFLFLPDGEDPDSLLRSAGSEHFQALLGDATPLSRFLLDQLQARHAVPSMEGRSELARAALQLITPMPDGLLKQQLLDSIAELTQIQRNHLNSGIPAIDPRKRQAKAAENSRQQSVRVTPMRVAISALISHPELAAQVSVAQVDVLASMPGGNLLNELVDLLHEEPELRSAMILERFRDHPAEAQLQQLSVWQPPGAEKNNWHQLLEDSLDKLQQRYREVRLDQLLRKKTLEPHEKEELRRLTTVSR